MRRHRAITFAFCAVAGKTLPLVNLLAQRNRGFIRRDWIFLGRRASWRRPFVDCALAEAKDTGQSYYC
jgi:hypothetical protein